MSRFDSPVQVVGLFLVASLVSVALIFLINAETEAQNRRAAAAGMTIVTTGTKSKRNNIQETTNEIGKEIIDSDSVSLHYSIENGMNDCFNVNRSH